ncbi:MAG: hypothetical protein AAGG51_28955 [Cyanobacteria bacterium P01_G01_bin.54]
MHKPWRQDARATGSRAGLTVAQAVSELVESVVAERSRSRSVPKG